MTPFYGYYRVVSYPYAPKEWEPATPRELLVRNVIASAGAAAGFTLERFWPDPRRARKKLLSLARAGLVNRVKLVGRKEMNVFTLARSFRLDPGLRQLAVAHFFALLRERVPCHLTPAGNFWVLSYPFATGWRHRRVLVFRSKSDDVSLLYPFLEHPALVISDAPVDCFRGFPVRLVLDEDLISGALRFYLPDGTPDRENPFSKN
jgi:hypothetical protein